MRASTKATHPRALAAAFTFTIVEAALGLGGAALGLAGPSVMQALRAPLAFWLPLALVFVATSVVGAVLLSIPTSQPAAAASAVPWLATAPGASSAG